MAEMGRFIKPILSVVPPDPGKFDPMEWLPLTPLAKQFRDLPRAPAGDVHPADDDVRGGLPRSVVRDRPAEGDDERARDHRHLPGAAVAGHRVRAAAPLHGRDRRRVPRLGHPAGRDGRRSRTRSPTPRSSLGRRDPHRGAGRADRRTRRSGHRRDARVRRGDRGRRRDVARSTRAGRSSSCSRTACWTPTFREEVLRYKYRGSSGKVNLALDGLPGARVQAGHRASGSAARSRSRRRSTTWSAPTTTRSTGGLRARPYIDCIMPTLVDPTMAPPGKHVMSCFVQYAPYHLADGEVWDDAAREAFGQNVIDTLEERFPDIRSKIVGHAVHHAQGHRGHHRSDRGQHLPGRAVARAAVLQPAGARGGRATARRCANLWMCGSATHPGGGIMGAPGRIAALEYAEGEEEGPEGGVDGRTRRSTSS